MRLKSWHFMALFLALLGGWILAGELLAGSPQTKVHKPTGDKIQVESGGEIELKSGATLDVQAGATVNMQGTVTPPASGVPLPEVDITVTSPTVSGVMIRHTDSVVYVSTNIIDLGGWVKVGGQ